jgi:hypothetical protein
MRGGDCKGMLDSRGSGQALAHEDMLVTRPVVDKPGKCRLAVASVEAFGLSVEGI